MLYKNLFQLYPDNFQNNYFLLSDKLEDIRYILLFLSHTPHTPTHPHTQDEEENVLKRDIAEPTLEDHFDKTVLPKVMQVKNFGRAGRTKYTHLVDQDTTEVIM